MFFVTLAKVVAVTAAIVVTWKGIHFLYYNLMWRSTLEYMRQMNKLQGGDVIIEMDSL